MQFNFKKEFVCYLFFFLFIILVSCNSAQENSTTVDSTATATDTSSSANIDTSTTRPVEIPSSVDTMGNENPPPPPPPPADTVKEQNEKGSVIVYCPSKMIVHVPSIINAEITKEELIAARSKFIQKIQQQDEKINVNTISHDVRGDSIDIYEKMRVAIELDPEDFKQISKDENSLQAFNNKNTLDWDWTIKPLHSISKSIIKFKFYGTDPVDNKEMDILEKTINVSVQVDARSFFEKWQDFLLDDPKTTITSILIPVITFLGGFFSAKRKKN